MAQTIAELLAAAREELRAAGVETPEVDARLLAAEALRLSTTQLVTRRGELVPEPLAAAYQQLVARRCRREPLPYLVGWTEFWGRRFHCDRRGLIPRPETEVLAEEALRLARELPAGAVVADVGTGTGCLALTLALECPHLRVWGTDLCPEALALARENARYHRLNGSLRLEPGSGLAPLLAAEERERVMLVVSNPPYVRSEEFAELQPEVRDWEPRLALDGGPEGLDCYRELLAQCAQLSALRHLLLEVGYDQAAEVAALGQAALGQAEAAVLPDLGGIPRVVRLSRAQPAGAAVGLAAAEESA